MQKRTYIYIYIFFFTRVTHSYTTYNNFNGVLKEKKGGKRKRKENNNRVRK